MTRNNKKWNPEKGVQEFFAQTKEYYTEYEFSVIEEGYECLKQVVAPDMYSEIAMELQTSVLTRKKKHADEILTLDKVINDVVSNLGLTNMVNITTERLRELNVEDASYVADVSETDAAIEEERKVKVLKKVSKKSTNK